MGTSAKLGVGWLTLSLFGVGSSFADPADIYYLWIPSFLLALALGCYLGYRVWRYAMNAANVREAWISRIKMTTGLIVTFFLGGYVFFAYAQADFTGYAFGSYIVYTGPPTYALVESQFYLSIFILLIPIAFGFLSGESYLLYRLRHHYSVSRW